MSNLSILIVEDEGIVAEDLANKVRQLGYDVADTAATGEAAVELARRHRPALVLMDIRLAGAMDGITAAQAIHHECNLPVLFLSAHSDMGTVERARHAEALGYIMKPFDERDLRIQIEMALYKHAAERRLRESEEQLKNINQILQAANTNLLDSRRATLNMMQDAVIARRQAEEVTVELQCEVAERKRAEEALQVLNDELGKRVEQRTLELQETQQRYLHAEKLSAIGKLSASIAHEFNNPLQGILSILNGLKKRAILEEEDRELLVAAIGEGNRIRDLIRSLQDFNRPSSGRKAVMDVHNSLDAILLLHKSDFNGRRISLVCDYAKRLPQILAVPDQIKQVFLNLLANAADACPRYGGVITVSTWQENERVAVAIKDTGIGIKPEDRDRIFQPFFTTKAEVKGTGLGLSVSYGIVKNHRGEIRVESRPGESATFTVLLPINGAEEVT